MTARFILVAAIAIPLSGCWPARFVAQPGVVGTVVSAADGKPVAGASVKLATARGDGNPGSGVTTDRNGKFQIEPLYHWGTYLFLGEGWPLQGSVEIDARGFSPGRLELSWPQTGPRTQDVGVIELKLTSP